jgi:hypothetical protein
MPDRGGRGEGADLAHRLTDRASRRRGQALSSAFRRSFEVPAVTGDCVALRALGATIAFGTETGTPPAR